MRPQTHYLRKDLSTGKVQARKFVPADYKKVGLMPAMASGIPQLEALTLINTWNVSQDKQRFMFGFGD